MPGIGIGVSPIGAGGSGDIKGIVLLDPPSNPQLFTGGIGELSATWTDPAGPVPFGIDVIIRLASDNSYVTNQLIGSGIGVANFSGLPSGIQMYADLYNLGGGGAYQSSSTVQTGTQTVP